MKSKLEGSPHRAKVTTGRGQESYCEWDIDQCRPHPAVIGMRFEYDSDALEQNMSDNGQLEPCRAVRDEQNLLQLLVYIGQRRLTAAKKLKSKAGVPSTLKVIIDEQGSTDEEIIKRALAENVDEHGERLSLTDLEKIAYTRSLLTTYDNQRTERLLENAGFERSTAKKIVSLVEKLDPEQAAKLHKIETKSNFRFRIAHLDLLLDSEDLSNFYSTAALAAFSQKPPEEIKALRLCSGYFSKDIPWFYEIFPEFAVRASKAELEDPKSQGDSSSRNEESHETTGKSEFNESVLESVIVVNCDYCKSANLFKLKTGSPEFVFCNLKEGGLIEKSASAANAVFDCERECSVCHKNFWVTASVLERGRVAIKTSSSKIVAAAGEEAALRKVYWTGEWMMYDEISRRKTKLDDLLAQTGELKQQSDNEE